MSAAALALAVVLVHVAHTLAGLPVEGIEQVLIATAQEVRR